MKAITINTVLAIMLGWGAQDSLQKQLDRTADACARITGRLHVARALGDVQEAETLEEALELLGQGAKEIQQNLALEQFERSFDAFVDQHELVPAHRDDSTTTFIHVGPELTESQYNVAIANVGGGARPFGTRELRPMDLGGVLGFLRGHQAPRFLCPDGSVTGDRTMFSESIAAAYQG